MTVWRPDTCQCIIEYDDNIKFIKSHNKCKLHILLDDQALLNSVILHNSTFNINFHALKQKEIYSNSDIAELRSIKTAEKERINKL